MLSVAKTIQLHHMFPLYNIAVLVTAEHKAKLAVDTTSPSDYYNDGEYLPTIGGQCLL